MEVTLVNSACADYVTDSQRLKKHCMELRSLMQNIWNKKLAKQDTSSANLFLHLRGLKEINRINQRRLKMSRDKTREEKLQIDQHYLRLQNLKCEILHLQNEINNCLSFKPASDNIQLVDVEEFYQQAPVKFTKPEITQKDEHVQMLARLAWERLQRQDYSEQLAALKKSCQELKTRIMERRLKLTEIQPHLMSLCEMTKPTAAVLGYNYHAEREEGAMAFHLPDALFILFSQLRALSQTRGSSISVEIRGDVSKAANFRLEERGKVTQVMLSGPDEDEFSGKAKKRKSYHNTDEGAVLKKYDDTLVPFPLSVLLVTSVENNKLQVEFTFYPQLGIVTVSPKVILSNDSKDKKTDVSGVILSEDRILDQLYPEDTCKAFPFVDTYATYRSVVSSLATSTEEPELVQSFAEYYGWPYCWAQVLAGLRGHPSTDNAHRVRPLPSLAFGIVDDVCTRIKARLLHRLRLFQEVRQIERGVAGTSPQLIHLKPSVLEMKKCVVKLSSYEAFLQHPSVQDIVSENLLQDSGIFYTIEALYSNVMAILDVYIPMDYPNEYPIGLVSIRNRASSVKETSQEISQLADMERMLNVEKIDNCSCLLEFMYVKFLVGCYSYVLSSQSAGPNIADPRVVLRSSKFTSRSYPLRYMKRINAFVHNA